LEYKQLFLDQPFHLRGERVIAQELARHFLIPWTGGAFAPLGPFLCPATEEKNGLLPQSQGPMTCID
jgi:hypothetical protein